MKQYRVVALVVCLVVSTIMQTAALGQQEQEHHFTTRNLRMVLESRRDTSLMAQAFVSTNAGEVLDAYNNYTLFIPTNSVFKALPERMQDAIMNDQRVFLEVIASVYVDDVLTSRELKNRGSVTTKNGQVLNLSGSQGSLVVNGSNTEAVDVYGNGFIVHVTRGINLPPIQL